ncbi:DUF3078 domain-containing protein [soil metagenome]
MNHLLRVTMLGMVLLSGWMLKGNAQTDSVKIMNDSVAVIAPAAEDTIRYWRYNGNIAANINQVALKNWSGGGQSAVGINLIFNFKTSYEKNSFSWDLRSDMAFGIQKIGKQGFRKSDDFFDIGSQLNYKLAKGWKFSFLTTLRSQFANGYDYADDGTSVLISKSFAPAYTIIAPGIEYTAPKYFKAMFSPVTNKNNIVLHTNSIDVTRYGVEPGKRVFAQFGAFLTATFEAEVFKNITYSTKLDLFSNYLKNPQNVDVNWNNKIILKVNEWLNVAITTELVYDDDVMVPKTREDGTTYEGKGTQFRENLAVSIGYKFARDRNVPAAVKP